MVLARSVGHTLAKMNSFKLKESRTIGAHGASVRHLAIDIDAMAYRTNLNFDGMRDNISMIMRALALVCFIMLTTAGTAGSQYLKLQEGLLLPVTIANPFMKTSDSCEAPATIHWNDLNSDMTRAFKSSEAMEARLREALSRSFSFDSMLPFNLYLSSGSLQTGTRYDSVLGRAYLDTSHSRMVPVSVIDLHSRELRRIYIYLHEGPRYNSLYSYDVASDRLDVSTLKYHGRNSTSIRVNNRTTLIATSAGTAELATTSITTNITHVSGESAGNAGLCTVPAPSRSVLVSQLRFTRQGCGYRLKVTEFETRR